MSGVSRELVEPPRFADALRGDVAAESTIDSALCREVRIEHDEPVTVSASRLERCDLRASRVRTLLDVELVECDLSNADWSGARLRRVRLSGCRATGLSLAGASLTDVSIERTGLRLSCWMEAECTRCWLEDTDIREADFDSARLDRVAIRECDLRGTRLVRTPLRRVDLRGSRLDGLVVSPELTRDCTIEPSQADTFAAALGIHVIPLDAEPPEA